MSISNNISSFFSYLALVDIFLQILVFPIKYNKTDYSFGLFKSPVLVHVVAVENTSLTYIVSAPQLSCIPLPSFPWLFSTSIHLVFFGWCNQFEKNSRIKCNWVNIDSSIFHFNSFPFKIRISSFIYFEKICFKFHF